MARKPTSAEGLLSIADISRHFSLPESTTRYYCKRFAAFIPSVGEGRRRRYRPETLDVILTILEEMQKSRTASAVEDTLLALFPRNALAVSGPALPSPAPAPQEFFSAPALQLLERQTTALEGIARLLQTFLEKLPAPAPENTEVSSLRNEVDALRILLDSSEKTQQADLEQLRQWMGKVIRTRNASPPADERP